MGADSYADVVERLFAEFERTVALPEIARLVGRCRQHWSGPGELDALEHEARRELTILSLSGCPGLPAVPAQRGSLAGSQRVAGSAEAALGRALTVQTSKAHPSADLAEA